MAWYSWLWPFRSKVEVPEKPIEAQPLTEPVTEEAIVPNPGTHVPPSDFLPRREPFLGGVYREKPKPPPMQSVEKGGWSLRSERRPMEVDSSAGDVIDIAAAIAPIAQDWSPPEAPVEPYSPAVETPAWKLPEVTPQPAPAPEPMHHESAVHHVDTTVHSTPSFDSTPSPSFDAGSASGSVSTGC